ncbi:MAG TPA: hypothetical protein VF590_18440, partial [Isosphaeraceae bacterium]
TKAPVECLVETCGVTVGVRRRAGVMVTDPCRRAASADNPPQERDSGPGWEPEGGTGILQGRPHAQR